MAAERPRKGGDKVFDRLSQPKGFTGAHKERFDEDGKGKGLAGREDASDRTKDLKQMTRPGVSKGAGPSGAARSKPSSSSSIEKFGVQADKAMNLYVFRNGDKNSKGDKVVCGMNFLKFEQLLAACSKVVGLPTGPVKKLLRVIEVPGGNRHSRVRDFDDLEDGGLYIACGPEPLSRDKYPKELGKPAPKKT